MKFDKNSFINKTNRDVQLGKVMILKQRYPRKEDDPNAFDRYYSSEAFKASELPQYFNEEYILRVCKDSYNPIITYLNIYKDVVDSIDESDDSYVYIFNAHFIADEGANGQFVDWWFSKVSVPTVVNNDSKKENKVTVETELDSYEPADSQNRRKNVKQPPRKTTKNKVLTQFLSLKPIKKLTASELKTVYKVGRREVNSYGIIDRDTHFALVINGYETDLNFNSLEDILNDSRTHVIDNGTILTFKSENVINRCHTGKLRLEGKRKSTIPNVIKVALENRVKKTKTIPFEDTTKKAKTETIPFEDITNVELVEVKRNAPIENNNTLTTYVVTNNITKDAVEISGDDALIDYVLKNFRKVPKDRIKLGRMIVSAIKKHGQFYNHTIICKK